MSATSRKYADVPLGYQLRISGLGAKIRSEREKLGLSSGDLSKMINARTEWLWQVETGYRTIGLHHVPILESALKTTLVDRQSLIENILSVAGKTP
jgi:ribosome-binding protein aMBF1 (putative translation factor)